MYEFNVKQIKDLERYLFDSFIHDAKIKSFSYDIVKKTIKIEVVNPIFIYSVSLFFSEVEFFLFTNGHYPGELETILSLTVEKESAVIQYISPVCEVDLNDCICLLFQLFSGSELYIACKIVSINKTGTTKNQSGDQSGSKQKTLTSNNIANSVFNIGFNTVIDGTVNLAVGEIAGTLIPTGNWIKPKKFVTSFFGKYATKVTGQACIQANINTWTNVTYSYLSVKYNDGQTPTIQLFHETYVE